MRSFLIFTRVIFAVVFAAFVLPVPDARAQNIRQVTPSSSVSTVVGRALQGDADAQFQAGSAYFTGNGVPVNKVEGVRFIRMAANQGHTVAETMMGTFYSLGDGGLTPNHAESMKWLRRAAVKGWSDAQLSLSFAYKDLRDVPDNDITAYSWFAIAQAQGNKLAVQFKDPMEKGMTQEDIIAGQKLALQCLASAYKNCG